MTKLRDTYEDPRPSRPLAEFISYILLSIGGGRVVWWAKTKDDAPHCATKNTAVFLLISESVLPVVELSSCWKSHGLPQCVGKTVQANARTLAKSATGAKIIPLLLSMVYVDFLHLLLHDSYAAGNIQAYIDVAR